MELSEKRIDVSMDLAFTSLEDVFGVIDLLEENAKLHPDVTYKVEFRETVSPLPTSAKYHGL